MQRAPRILTVSCLLMIAACDLKGAIARPEPSTLNDQETPGAGQPGTSADAVDGGVSSEELQLRSRHPALQWKRYAAFEADLAAALELPKEALCKELDGANCIRGVHLSPLGGHDPFTSGLLEPSGEPLATTPSVVERIVLSACVARAELERTEKPKVFAGLDLSGPAPAPSDPALASVVSALYRRFLSRDPDPYELEIVASLALDDAGKAASALTFAKSACFAVGTSSEFLFF